jgi:hypothetical protein
MAKLGKNLKLKVTVGLVPKTDTVDCPECKTPATIVTEIDSVSCVCPTCGIHGYRYETKALAIRDFPNHHGLPNKKRAAG